jgi:DNA-binding NarL/FixJ family response regulator
MRTCSAGVLPRLEGVEGRGRRPPQAMTGPPVRVFVVDDHPMMRDGLRDTFAKDDGFQVVGVAGDSTEARESFDAAKPDVVVMDYSLPGKDGITLAGELKARRPAVRVLILTSNDDPSVVARAVSEGCDGFLLKTEPPATIVAGVRRLHAGEVLFDARQLSDVMQHVRSREGAPVLSKRELEVLRLLAQGTSTKDMAAQLFVSVNTIRTHVRKILEKLDAHSKLEAVVFAIRDGVLRPNDLDEHA